MLLIAVAMVSFSACSSSSGELVINDDSEISAGIDESAGENEGYYSNKVYYVGEDLPAGGYVISCTGTDFYMSAVVFENERSYEEFQDAKKTTVGDVNEAVEIHAWADFYLEQDEKAYIGLRKGNVILLNDGKCEFSKYNPDESQTVYSGIYVVGEDIEADKLNIKCISDYLQVTVFDSRDSYLAYHRSGRFTIGEESDAIEEFADSTDVVYEEESTYVNLSDKMIMMVEEGTGKYSIDKGPIIN